MKDHISPTTERSDTQLRLACGIVSRLASALWWFWITRSYFSEGREWMERLLASKRASTVDQLSVKAYVRDVYLMSYLLDNPQLYKIAEEGLRRARKIEDPESMAIALLMMAGDPYYADDLGKSGSLLEETLSLFRQCENVWGIATVLRAQAAISEVRLRDHARARYVVHPLNWTQGQTKINCVHEGMRDGTNEKEL